MALIKAARLVIRLFDISEELPGKAAKWNCAETGCVSFHKRQSKSGCVAETYRKGTRILLGLRQCKGAPCAGRAGMGIYRHTARLVSQAHTTLFALLLHPKTKTHLFVLNLAVLTRSR